MKSSNYTLYIHVAPNDKKYIGITSVDPEKRWGKNGYRYKSNPYFWNAIQKYGWDNFQHLILFENLSKEDADKKEKELISKYKTHLFEFGFNRDMGGFHSGFHSKATLKKINDSRKKKVYQYNFDGELIAVFNSLTDASTKTNISLNNLSLCCLNKTKSAGNFLWSYTNNESDILQKIKSNNNKVNDGSIKKKVYQIDLKTGKIIKEYSSITEASKSNNLEIAGISSCCQEKLLSYSNFIWSFCDSKDYITKRLILNSKKLKSGSKRNVAQIDLITGNIINIFNSLTEASNYIKTSVCNISTCCSGKTKSSCGFAWEYYKKDGF